MLGLDGFEVREVPRDTAEDWKERQLHPALDSWSQVSAINAGLTEFGQIVCEVMKEEYVDWESEFDAPDDLPDY